MGIISKQAFLSPQAEHLQAAAELITIVYMKNHPIAGVILIRSVIAGEDPTGVGINQCNRPVRNPALLSWGKYISAIPGVSVWVPCCSVT